MGLEHLAGLVLEQVTQHPVNNSWYPPPDGCSPGRLNTDQLGVGVDESGKYSSRVRAAPNTRRHHVGNSPDQVETLSVGLGTDNALELSHHPWIRVWAHD